MFLNKKYLYTRSHICKYIIISFTLFNISKLDILSFNMNMFSNLIYYFFVDYICLMLQIYYTYINSLIKTTLMHVLLFFFFLIIFMSFD